MKISGITFIHNGVEFDYCFEEAIRSMLPVCDEVVVVEAESTDETREVLESIDDPKIRIIEAPWKPAPLNSETNTDWTKDLGEIARLAAIHPYVVYVQGDEVLHEKDYGKIRDHANSMRPYFVHRYNFWMDTHRLIPHGKCCGHWVCRLAPRNTKVFYGSESLDPTHAHGTDIGLYHYGFLRKITPFRKKAEIMLPNFCGSMDPRIYQAEKEGIQSFRQYWPAHEDIPFAGTHPAAAHQWLKERGYDY